MRPWSKPPGGTDSVFTERDWLCLNIMGRLKDGVTREQAQGALDAVFHQFVTADWHPPKESDIPHFILAPGGQGLPVVQDYTAQPIYLLMVAVGLLLLIACAFWSRCPSQFCLASPLPCAHRKPTSCPP